MDRKVDYIELLNSFESLKTLTTESLGILPLQSIEPENLKNEPKHETEQKPIVTSHETSHNQLNDTHSTNKNPIEPPLNQNAPFKNTAIRDPKLIEALVEFHQKHSPTRSVSKKVISPQDIEPEKPQTINATKTEPASATKSIFNPMKIPIVDATPKPRHPLLKQSIRTTQPILKSISRPDNNHDDNSDNDTE